MNVNWHRFRDNYGSYTQHVLCPQRKILREAVKKYPA
jgi:hypothetical protein